MAANDLNLPAETRIPDHIAIIPDGNRRWARARGKHTLFGHKKGFDLVPQLVTAAREMGVHTTTLWAFSTENWDRSQEEIDYLMKMYEGMIKHNLKQAHKDKSKIIHLGRKDRIPKNLAKKIEQAESETRNYQKFILNIALDYGGHDEINRAIGKMVEELQFKSAILNRSLKDHSQQGIEARPWEEVVGEYAKKYPIFGLANYLDTAGQPYPFPDLMIRTSGEHRTSGLLTWQSAYTEYYFIDIHFPDFEVPRLKEAIIEFSRRRRRFGGNDLGAHLYFNPEKLSKSEIQGWRDFRNGDLDKTRKNWESAINQLYGFKNGIASQAVQKLIESRMSYQQGDMKLAKLALNGYFTLIKQGTGFTFDPVRVSDLEINVFQLLNPESNLFDRHLAEEIMIDNLAEQFRINRLQATKAAHLKTLALLEVNSTQSNGLGERYLTQSYRALKEMVA